jgi:Protein of unknown function (DUF3592)
MPDLPWFVYAWPLLMIGVVVVAAVYKLLEVRQAAGWPQTTGKVVVSTAQVRKVKTFDDDRKGGRGEEQRNFANVVYEYEVSGQKLRNNRVSIGEDLGNFGVEDTLAQYPVGKIVTVYYNPRTPREAVLERDPPSGIVSVMVYLIVGALVLWLGSFYGLNQITQALRGLLVNPQHAPMVVGLSAMGAMAFLFGLANRRHGRSAGRWPVVAARVDQSRILEFEGPLTKRGRPTRKLYRPVITYRYEYNGVSYTGDHSSLGFKITANTDAFAKKLVAKYPVGTIVKLHVNPQNASESMLNPSSFSRAWFFWSVALLLWAGAYWIAQRP